MRGIYNHLRSKEIKPKLSVIVVTLGRPSLYKLIKKLLNQNIDCKYEVILISSNPLREHLLKDKKIKLYYEPLGKGFSYYRNVGIAHSRGDIIVFIDDDTEPIDEHWLKNLTQCIIQGNEKCATAGLYIPLGQGYIADSISFLGFPGGGYVGFKTMWDVDEKGYTSHLCTGNFAIKKNVLKRINGFNENLKFGAEDVELAGKLVEKNIKIKYVEQAIIYHEPRRELKEFIRWQIRRGKASCELKKIGKLKGSYMKRRLKSSIKILRKSLFTKYFPMVLFLIIIQYLLTVKYLLRKK